MIRIVSALILLAVFLAACSSSQATNPLLEEPQALPSTATSAPTEPAESFVPAVSDTPVPTETFVPTETNTPEPTSTPTITPTFSPETLTFTAGEPLKIGYLLWENHHLGIDSLRGIELSIRDFGGQLFGHPIELTGFDTECNELAGQRGAQNLVRDESVIGIIGTTCSVSALRAAPIVSDAGRVLISPSNSLTELTATDFRTPGYFRTAPNDILQVNAVAEYAYQILGARRLATVYVAASAYQRLQSDALCESFITLGGECVLERTMEAGSTYMDPIINGLVEAMPDIVYFMNGDLEAGAAFLETAKSTPGLEDTAIFFWEVYNQAGFLQIAGDDALGVYVSVTTYDFDQGTSAYLAFLEAYQSSYSQEPLSLFHAYAYDATSLLLRALEEVAVQSEDGTLMIDPLAIREGLYNVAEFSGLSGWIACSQQGDCARSAQGRVYEFTSGDPITFNPGPADSLSSNPAQVWP